ncbi:MAG: ParE family toxin-like protein [Hafnia alvei]|uniref:ParE family toxin-like protein n=1 Tax=Hafnia alvei TaxID=569 RepID=UPI003F92E7D2
MTLSGSRANPRIYSKALALLTQFENGRRIHKRIKPHGYLKINIGIRWRLLSKNGGKHCRLMTHERYNVEIWK